LFKSTKNVQKHYLIFKEHFFLLISLFASKDVHNAEESTESKRENSFVCFCFLYLKNELRYESTNLLLFTAMLLPSNQKNVKTKKS
jgi:hypothetical protein